MSHTAIILIAFFGFMFLAAILLIPVYRFLKAEEAHSASWTREQVAARNAAREAAAREASTREEAERGRAEAARTSEVTETTAPTTTNAATPEATPRSRITPAQPSR
jgi:flagellar basal body-associated protein FliL